MEKRLKITGFIGILVLYCLTAGIYGFNPDVKRVVSADQTEVAFSASPVSSWLNLHQEESSVSVPVSTARTSMKNSFNQFSFCALATDKILFIRYLPYVFYPQINIARFKSTDIIYPAHYFW